MRVLQAGNSREGRKIMNIEQLHAFFDDNNLWKCGAEFKGLCCDCQKETIVTIDAMADGFHISGGAEYTLSDGTHKVKCPECYALNPKYEQECEVFSRVVGYLRPTKNWNTGKVAEFNNRKMFKGLE